MRTFIFESRLVDQENRIDPSEIFTVKWGAFLSSSFPAQKPPIIFEARSNETIRESRDKQEKEYKRT